MSRHFGMWHLGESQRSWAPISQFAHSHSHQGWSRLVSGRLPDFIIVLRLPGLKDIKTGEGGKYLEQPTRYAPTSSLFSLGSYSTM
jgi:hypothetical protein